MAEESLTASGSDWSLSKSHGRGEEKEEEIRINGYWRLVLESFQI